MSHIDNITRATKAYHILAQATNVHLDLDEMINRLGLTGHNRDLVAAYKALTGETTHRHFTAMPRDLIKNFWRALDITGNSFQDKVAQLNEFGNDIHLADLKDQQQYAQAAGFRPGEELALCNQITEALPGAGQ